MCNKKYSIKPLVVKAGSMNAKELAALYLSIRQQSYLSRGASCQNSWFCFPCYVCRCCATRLGSGSIAMDSKGMRSHKFSAAMEEDQQAGAFLKLDCYTTPQPSHLILQTPSGWMPKPPPIWRFVLVCVDCLVHQCRSYVFLNMAMRESCCDD